MSFNYIVDIGHFCPVYPDGWSIGLFRVDSVAGNRYLSRDTFNLKVNGENVLYDGSGGLHGYGYRFISGYTYLVEISSSTHGSYRANIRIPHRPTLVDFADSMNPANSYTLNWHLTQNVDFQEVILFRTDMIGGWSGRSKLIPGDRRTFTFPANEVQFSPLGYRISLRAINYIKQNRGLFYVSSSIWEDLENVDQSLSIKDIAIKKDNRRSSDFADGQHIERFLMSIVPHTN
jgi:hypothetical protein